MLTIYSCLDECCLAQCRYDDSHFGYCCGSISKDALNWRLLDDYLKTKMIVRSLVLHSRWPKLTKLGILKNFLFFSQFKCFLKSALCSVKILNNLTKGHSEILLDIVIYVFFLICSKLCKT